MPIISYLSTALDQVDNKVNSRIIGVVAPIDYLAIKSGMAQRIKADLAGLSYGNYAVEVILPSNVSKSSHYLQEQLTLVTYHNLQRVKFLSEKIRLLFDMCTQMVNPFFILALKKRYKRYSVIFAHSPWSVVASYQVVKKQIPIIYVAHDFEYGRVKQVWRNPLVRYFVYRIENYACFKASSILCVSQSDMKAMETTYCVPAAKLSLLPNTVDVDFFSNTHALYGRVTERKALGVDASAFLLLFHGRMDYSPNLEALNFILKELMPALTDLGSNIKLIIAGARIPKRYLGDENEIISFYSDVPDMRRFLAVADAVIVPLSIGGGTRLKILESFAANVPVISTAKGAEGIDCRDGHHILIAQRTAHDFINKLKLLAENENLSKKLVRNAFNLAVRKYSAPMVRKQLEKIISWCENIEKRAKDV